MLHFYPLLLATTIAVLSLLQPCHAACKNFTPLLNPYNDGQVYTSLGRTVRVSEVVNCTGPNLGSQPSSSLQQRCNASTCSLAMPFDYYVRVNSTLNVSVSSAADLRNIFDLAKFNVSGLHPTIAPTDLNVTMVHQIDTASSCLMNGTAGYWAFTPTLNCVQGILGGCGGDTSTLDGTAVTVCGVKMLGSGYTTFDGTLSVVYTNGISSTDPEPAPANATMTGTNPLPTSDADMTRPSFFAFLAVLGGVVLTIL